MVKGLKRRPPQVPSDTVEVACAVCKLPLTIARDALRDMVENGHSPKCGRGPKLCVPPTPAEVEALRQHQRIESTVWAKTLSKADRLMIALIGITEGEATARKEAIVVEVWQRNRKEFGLRGYEQTYPDSNRVIMELVKLVTQKMVENPASCEYRPTPFGRKYAEKLTGKA